MGRNQVLRGSNQNSQRHAPELSVLLTFLYDGILKVILAALAPPERCLGSERLGKAESLNTMPDDWERSYWALEVHCVMVAARRSLNLLITAIQ